MEVIILESPYIVKKNSNPQISRFVQNGKLRLKFPYYMANSCLSISLFFVDKTISVCSDFIVLDIKIIEGKTVNILL